MTILKTSENFAAAASSGTDWRDTAKNVLEALGSIRTENDGFTLGFLYVTDDLVPELENILSLFRSILGIRHWTGAAGPVICGTGCEYHDAPAISAMIGRFKEDDFRVFPPVNLDSVRVFEPLQPWIERQSPFLALVHGDPETDPDPAHAIPSVASETGAFLAGGLVSARNGGCQIADQIVSGGLSGVLFGGGVRAVTMKAQGCAPLSRPHKITRREENVIRELDGRRALDVLTDDLKAFARACGSESEQEAFPPAGDDRIMVKNALPALPPAGEIHAAFPVTGSDDPKDYMVRPILGIDPDEGAVLVRYAPSAAEMMGFVRRDRDTARIDLSKNLLALRERVIRQEGAFRPKGGIFISCKARAAADDPAKSEAELVQEILGDVPLAGFYADGEISHHRLYGYTSVLILFL